MTAWLRWYAAVQALGLLALPLTFSALRRLPDRGYFFSKAVGVLVHGLVLWLGTSYGLLRNDAGGAVLAALALAGLSVLLGRDACQTAGGSPRGWLRANARLVAAAEVLFLASFAGWAIVRAHDPAANHTERPMDLLFLTGIHVSPDFPPRDPWLAGFPIAYYYLGHWLLNAVGLLSGQPPAVAVNLGQACWLALLLAGCFGLGFDLVALDRPTSPKTALAAGLLAAVTVALAGNPQGTLDALQRGGLRLGALARGRAAYNFSVPGEPWWWWRASRVLEDRDAAGQHVEVIDEFPAFSYVVGDAHPHLLAMPFVALALALALNLHLAARDGGLGSLEDRPGRVLSVVAVGALPALNAWDFPLQWLVSTLAVGLGLRLAREGRGGLEALRRPAVWGARLAAGAALVSLPYLLTAQSQVEGLRLDASHPTPPFQLLLMLGPLLAGTAILLLLARMEARPSPGPLAAGLLAAIVVPHAALADPPWSALLLTVLLGFALAALAKPRPAGSRQALPFALLLAAAGLLLLLVPELLYVQDGFGTRMNTIFKLYYQAWLLLGVATAYAVATAWADRPSLRLASRATLALVLAGLLYTGAAVGSVTVGFGSPAPSLDALGYVREGAPGEHAAMLWVRDHTDPHALVLQARGRSYAPEDARLSVATGRGTLLGWEGHELQWRGPAYATMAAGRAEALETVYRLADAATLEASLEAWGVDYVFVGPAERGLYGIDAEREGVFESAMEPVFAQGSVRLYRRRER